MLFFMYFFFQNKVFDDKDERESNIDNVYQANHPNYRLPASPSIKWPQQIENSLILAVEREV